MDAYELFTKSCYIHDRITPNPLFSILTNLLSSIQYHNHLKFIGFDEISNQTRNLDYWELFFTNKLLSASFVVKNLIKRSSSSNPRCCRVNWIESNKIKNIPKLNSLKHALKISNWYAPCHLFIITETMSCHNPYSYVKT